MNQRYDRRLFLSRTTRAVGGLTILSSPLLLWACGGDDDDSDAGSATTSGGTTGTTAGGSATTSGSTSSGGGGAAGTVGTQFNWVPDVEWAAWYLGDANGHFAEYNVTSELGHGGPNTPAVVQVLAAGDGNVGISASELDITQANAEGSDFVIIGSMYQRNPLGLTWLAGTTIESAEDLVDKRVGGPQGDQVQFEAVLKINGLPTDQYEYIPMTFDPQPLVDGEMDVIISYVTNQPIQLALAGNRGRGRAVLRLRPPVLRRHPLRVEGMDRREPRPGRALPRRPARRCRGQPHRPDGRDPDPRGRVRR